MVEFLTRRQTWFAIGCILASSPQATIAEEPAAKHHLGIRGTQFIVNDRPSFFLGCSYYGALGADETTWRADLDDMQRAGINWIRVWATWAAFGRDVSAVDAEGAPREPYLDKLKELVAECDRRGMVVDVTLSRGNGATGPSRLAKLATHQRAVETLVTALKPWRNWYLDLSNERNIHDKRFTSFEDLKALRTRVRELDPKRLVTASQGGDISEKELEKYLGVGVDFVTPHRPRGAESPGETEETTRKLLAWTRKLGRVVPVHYQEPFRRSYGESLDARAFETDLRGAIAGGAAGWCFHNGSNRSTADGRPRRSFDLTSERLFVQLDDVERSVVSRLKEIVTSTRRKLAD
jgi:hypothetical protein